MYHIRTTENFDRQFKKLDPSVQRLVKNWITKHLSNCEDPRVYGKGLVAEFKGYWRYRIGDYRLIAEIIDDEMVIIAIAIAHRSEVYRNKIKALQKKKKEKKK